VALLLGLPGRGVALEPAGVAKPEEANQSTHEITAADPKSDFLIFMFS
jgi:hypothetical protein